MPLDRDNGEVLGGLNAGPHIVIEPRHLAALTEYRTEYTPKREFTTLAQAKMRRPYRPVFEDAVQNAIEAFADKGAFRPIRFDEDDVIVQVYPGDMKLAVIFQRSIACTIHYSRSFYDLPPAVLDALLAASGMRVLRRH